MRHEEAVQCAIGYSWGREDASGVKTFEPEGQTGCHAFATMFATCYDAYSREQRPGMTSVQTAYDTWQATNGATILREEVTRPDGTPDRRYTVQLVGTGTEPYAVRYNGTLIDAAPDYRTGWDRARAHHANHQPTLDRAHDEALQLVHQEAQDYARWADDGGALVLS